MGSRIVVGGKEVTNPLAKAFICILAVAIAVLVTALVIFFVLPLVGITIALSVGVALLIPIAIMLAIPLFMLGGAVLSVLLMPFVVLARVIRRGHRRNS